LNDGGQEDAKPIDGDGRSEESSAEHPDKWIGQRKLDPLARELLLASEVEVPELLHAHRLLLFCVQEPGRLGRFGEKNPACSTDGHCNAELDDEKPPPRRESMSSSHSLDRVCEEPTKSPGDALREVGGHYPLPRQLSRVDCGEEESEALRQPGFSGIQNHADHNRLGVILDESRPERCGTPQDESSADGGVGAEFLDRQDPRHLEDDGADAGEGDDVAELAAVQVEFSVEAEDSCVAQLDVDKQEKQKQKTERVGRTLLRSKLDKTRKVTETGRTKMSNLRKAAASFWGSM
jgi:hypothetical protein